MFPNKSPFAPGPKILITPSDLAAGPKPRHFHRRTLSKTSDELLKSLKIGSPQLTITPQLITPELVINQFAKKGLHLNKDPKLEESTESLSDDELTIRNIIEQRKALSPAIVGKFKKPIVGAVERVSLTASSTHCNVSSESNVEKLAYVLEKEFFITGESRKAIVELMKKSPEPHFSLVLDEEMKLKGIFYTELATNYFHKVVGDDDLPIVLPPRRVKEYFTYDMQKAAFMNGALAMFDAVVIYY